MSIKNSKKELYFIEEVREDINNIKKGICELKKINSANVDYYTPSRLLADGLEKLMKCIIIIFAWYENNEEFPSERPYEKTHNLIHLKEKIIEKCKSIDYRSKFPAAESDMEFFENDMLLNEILNVLSDFGNQGRYYRLNIITGEIKGKEIEDGWINIENKIAKEKNLMKMLEDPTNLNYVIKQINLEVIKTLERFVRGLSRIFTKADLGDFPKEAICGRPFLYLMDDELGEIKYCNE